MESRELIQMRKHFKMKNKNVEVEFLNQTLEKIRDIHKTNLQKEIQEMEIKLHGLKQTMRALENQ